MHDGFATVDSKQEKSLLLLTQIVGKDGESGQGRLGVLEKIVMNLQKFRWQVLAIVAVGLAIIIFIVRH